MKRQLLALALLAALSAAAAPKLRVDTDKDVYDLGETMTFLVTAQENGASVAANVTWELKSDFGQNDAKGQATLDPAAPLKVEAKMTKPGFAKLTVKLADENFKPVKDVRFIASAGAALDQMTGVPEPEDFDAWWTKQVEIANSVDLAGAVLKDASPAVAEKHKGMKVRSLAIPFEVDGRAQLATAWVIMPDGAAEKSVPFLALQFQGYGFGGRNPSPWYNKTQAITLDVNAHGFELDREPEYYKEFQDSRKNYGIPAEEHQTPEQSYFRFMTLRNLVLLRWAKQLPEWKRWGVWAQGGSQGGFQCIALAALDHSVTLCQPNAPWLCDLGAAQELGRMGSTFQPKYTPAMRYFDTATLAKRIDPKCQVNILRAGLGDYCCPPSGVTVLYNNIPGSKKAITYVQGSEHNMHWGGVPKDVHTFKLQPKKD